MKTFSNLTKLSLLYLIPNACLAGAFGEGFSSLAPGEPSDISTRAFTIYTLQEACDRSPTPVELRVLPNPLVLKVGDRLHRSNGDSTQSELIIEAYGENGEFLPAVPIIVSTMDSQSITESKSNWNYLEALLTGEDIIVAA